MNCQSLKFIAIAFDSYYCRIIFCIIIQNFPKIGQTAEEIWLKMAKDEKKWPSDYSRTDALRSTMVQMYKLVFAVQCEKVQSSDLKTIVEIFWNSGGKVVQKTTIHFDVLYPCGSVAKYGCTYS